MPGLKTEVVKGFVHSFNVVQRGIPSNFTTRNNATLLRTEGVEQIADMSLNLSRCTECHYVLSIEVGSEADLSFETPADFVIFHTVGLAVYHRHPEFNEIWNNVENKPIRVKMDILTGRQYFIEHRFITGLEERPPENGIDHQGRLGSPIVRKMNTVIVQRQKLVHQLQVEIE